MMLHHLGLHEQASGLERAIDAVYKAGERLTPDQGGSAAPRTSLKAVDERTVVRALRAPPLGSWRGATERAAADCQEVAAEGLRGTSRWGWSKTWRGAHGQSNPTRDGADRPASVLKTVEDTGPLPLPCC